ncbi:MAG: AI-2E family transporter [Actinobacteria bacterium]|nr:AI-2E family transporter [Actinomycetota bacterium]
MSILGVKFALVLAVFSGFAEIIPIIGPITAGAVAALVVLLSGVSNFPINPIQGAAIVVAIYFFARQFEDYFIIPQVMGKITELHPLIILFAVISGGHVLGVIGLVLAVPIAGAIKILINFSLDKINASNK